MAEVNKHPSVHQAYNFNRDVHVTVGHMTKLKVGDVEFATDTEVTVPGTAEDKATVVGILSQFYWEGGYADNLQFRGQLSTANKQDLYLLIHKDMVSTDVTFQFIVYDYDPIAKTFYKSVHSNETDMAGLLSSSGSKLDITIDDDPATEVESPENYSFSIGINPKEQAQSVHMAASNTKKFAKPWGVKVE